jgi:uncharacterized protein (TIGR00288 family)
MEEKQNIAVFVDYDNIEIGVKSTLRREFDVSITLDSLRERGDVVAKFAYANWGLQPRATRQMAENAVQMVQRNPSPRGDKNGGDINLALDALEMAFTHDHVNAFAIISGDSDFNPLVNKLKEYGKTVYIIGGKAFTSNILQQNCHEFISYESLIKYERKPEAKKEPAAKDKELDREKDKEKEKRGRRRRPQALDLARAVPLIKRTLQVLERRNVQPQLGLLKSTMLQLDARFTERDYGVSSFSELIDKLSEAGYVKVTGKGGQATIETKGLADPEKVVKPEAVLPLLREILEAHRLEMEYGCTAELIESWIPEKAPDFELKTYGFQEFAELLNYAQDKLVVRIEPNDEEGLLVYLGEEFRSGPGSGSKPPVSQQRSARKSTRRPRKRAAPKE